MKISDELRVWSDICCNGECGEYFGLLADRIDNEMVELPRDADGVHIHVGDEVYTPSENVANVTSIRFHVMCSFHGGGGVSTTFSPTDLTHARPDSFERIANDIETAEGWCDGEGEYGTGITSVKESTLREWAERIRKLAEKEDK